MFLLNCLGVLLSTHLSSSKMVQEGEDEEKKQISASSPISSGNMLTENHINGSAADHEKKKKKKVGGIRTMPFILGNEFCDKFAATGFHANMITYLTQELHMPLVKASTTLTNFAGTGSLTPIIGALIADSFAGRFWTITVGSLVYQLGMISLTISAVLPSLRPPPCRADEECQQASALQLWVLYISLLLTAIGTGGLRPCVVAFGADQFDIKGAADKKAKISQFFNWYYFCMGIATLIALTVVVYIQDNVGWGWGLGLPTIAMAISVIAFVIGYPLYRRLKPGGSPMIRLAQVVAAAVKKRKAAKPDDPSQLYVNKELDELISNADGSLHHTNQLKLFDRAAIVEREKDFEEETGKPKLWRIATVHRVEELKSIIRMAPIWSVGILLHATAAHHSTFAILQARTMDRHIWPGSKIQIPPASMSVFTVLTLLAGIALYDRILVPFLRRLTHNPRGISYLKRMGVGLFIGLAANLVAAAVEIKRKNTARDYGVLDKPGCVIPISVFWLVPQYSLQGLGETFMLVGHLEFLYDQSPESMRSTAAALFWLAASAGNYLNTFIVSAVHKYTGKQRNWLPDRDLNKGRLECYYWLVSGLQVVNIVYYVICASFYKYKPVVEEVDGELESPAVKQGSLEGHVQLV